jgi:dipeptidyl aminopeptidase/acylaminoacyl peptidase
MARAGDGNEARAGVEEGKATLSVVRDGKEHACAAEACRGRPIGWIAWRPGRAELLFAVRDVHLRDQLFLWDLGQDRVRRLAGGDGTLSGGGYNRDLPCAAGPADLICIAEGPASPPRLVAIDLDSGRSRDLFDPNRALRAKRMPRVRWLEWMSGNGRTATGVLLSAPGTGDAPRPLFVTYYRCLGFLKGGEGGEWPLASLVEAGFSVACINAVSSGDSQDALQSYRDAQSAIEALVGKLGREGVIDPRRIGMGGFSFGSEVTMWMLARTRLLGAASIASPQIEPAYYWINAMRGRDQPALLASVWGIGPPGTTEERWSLVSPTASAARIDAPLLMQLSEQEARLDPELHARLSRSVTPVELYAFPDEAHFKVQPIHQWHAMTRNLDWFRYWLLEAVDGDPAKAGQYGRWKGLRGRAPEPLPAP